MRHLERSILGVLGLACAGIFSAIGCGGSGGDSNGGLFGSSGATGGVGGSVSGGGAGNLGVAGTLSMPTAGSGGASGSGVAQGGASQGGTGQAGATNAGGAVHAGGVGGVVKGGNGGMAQAGQPAVGGLGGQSAQGGVGVGPGGNGAGGEQGGSGDGGQSAGGSGGGGDDCVAGSKLVYVFSSDNQIWSFDPPSKQFQEIATPDCSVAGLMPNSMAIDRNLVAWLNYTDMTGLGEGQIFTFDLKTKSGCAPSGITLPSGFTQVGMGFSSDVAGGNTETLYIDGIGGAGLARIDMSTKTVIPIGAFANDAALAGQSAELTGTGDARLYGYFTTNPVRVAGINKSDAAIMADVPLAGIAPPMDWAFSFWGGDFYLYAAPGSNASQNSSVIHYAPKTDAVEPAYIADVGFVIIGAGVSTCAPTSAP